MTRPMGNRIHILNIGSSNMKTHVPFFTIDSHFLGGKNFSDLSGLLFWPSSLQFLVVFQVENASSKLSHKKALSGTLQPRCTPIPERPSWNAFINGWTTGLHSPKDLPGTLPSMAGLIGGSACNFKDSTLKVIMVSEFRVSKYIFPGQRSDLFEQGLQCWNHFVICAFTTLTGWLMISVGRKQFTHAHEGPLHHLHQRTCYFPREKLRLDVF